VCVGIPIPLNLDKLHCIIIAMSCIHASHDHADYFAVVVSVHLLFVVVFCFFPDRTLRGVVSNDKFFGSLSTHFSGEPFSLYPFTLLLSLALYSSLVSRCFVRVMCPIHLFIQSKAIEPSIYPINRVLVV
jgi:hypothetical protein